MTEQGEQDARKLAGRVRAVRFSRVFTSPLQRARRTCELAGLGEFAEIEPDLTEWDYGDYEGQRPADIREARPDWNVFRDGCPRGESPAQVSERADRLIARLRTLEGNVAIFSHGHVGRVLAARWIGLQVRQAQHFLLTTAHSASSVLSTTSRTCRPSPCGTPSRTKYRPSAAPTRRRQRDNANKKSD